MKPVTTAQQIEAVRALARATRVLERASGELSLAHYRVLAAIASGDERASRVANRLAIGKPTVSVAVEALA
jgi:DNA-binding MarR family transcriptional regulator